MFIALSSGKILNLAHCATIDWQVPNRLSVKLATGQHDISQATEDDWNNIKNAVNDHGKITQPDTAQPKQRTRAAA